MEMLVAPVDERTRFPLSAPAVAVEATRTLSVALALPAIGVIMALEPKVELSVEISKPVGATAVMSAVRFVPLTLML